MQKATSLEYEPSSEPQDAPGVEDGDSHASDDPYGLEIVFQKSIPTQIRQLILDISNRKG